METTTKTFFEPEEGEEYDKLCGKLFLTTKRNIIIHCTLCERKYLNFVTYVNHIKDIHNTNSDEEDCWGYSDEEYDVVSLDETEIAIAEKEIRLDEIGKSEDQKEILIDETEIPIKFLQKKSEIQHIQNGKTIIKDSNPVKEMDTIDDSELDFENAINKPGKVIAIPSENGLFKCTECDLRFPLNFMLKEHVKEHEVDRKFKCKVCKMLFKKGYLLAAHMRRHAIVKKFQCNECEKSFITQSELSYHQRKHKGEKPFQCEDCGKTFTYRSNLKLHRKRQHLNQPDYPCPLCEKSYFTSRHLRDHMSKHTDECSYRCDKCEKTFKQQGALTRHRRQHRLQEEEKMKTNNGADRYEMINTPI